MNVARWLILKDIYYHQPTSLVDISKRRFIEKSTTRQILKIFEEQALVHVEVDKQDKRHKIIQLTSKGLTLFETINTRILEMDRELLNSVNYDESTYEISRQFINKLLNNML